MVEINLKTASEIIFSQIAELREQKGKGNETVEFIDEVLVDAHDVLIELFLEKALVYQHNYMEEKIKENPNDEAKNEALDQWEEVLKLAQSHVETHKLSRWNSRIYRFLGRLSDYRGKYQEAIDYYDKSLESVGLDPKKINKGVPMELELNGFKAYSLIKLGHETEGMELAKKAYSDFNTEIGLSLKEKDYATWAIWKTGIAFRVTEALLEGGAANKDELKVWVNEAGKSLLPPEGVSSKFDFSFRKSELENLQKKLL